MQIQQKKSSSTSKNFIDPDTNSHTQAIEGFWSVIKRKLCKQGTNLDRRMIFFQKYMKINIEKSIVSNVLINS